MRNEPPRNCGVATTILTDEEAFFQAAEICDQAVNALLEKCGSVGRSITYLSRHYGLKPAWLQRLRERRPTPIYHVAYHNLLTALEDAIARKEAEIELQKARLQASRQSNASREIGLPAVLGMAPPVHSATLGE